MRSCYPVEIPHDELHQTMSPTALQTLELEVTQYRNELEGSVARCTRWVYDDIIPAATGLGGPGLTCIDMSVAKPQIGPRMWERVLSRRLVKVADDGWQIVE